MIMKPILFNDIHYFEIKGVHFIFEPTSMQLFEVDKCIADEVNNMFQNGRII